MRLPVLKSCCGCASLTTGAYILGSMAVCGAIVSIGVSSWPLPQHKSRAPEDNLVGLMCIMNSTLSVIFNIVLLVGVCKGRPSYLQVSMLFNALFVAISCILVFVKCLWSPEYHGVCFTLAHALLGALLVTAAVIFVIYYFLIINSLHIRLKQTTLVPTPVPV